MCNLYNLTTTRDAVVEFTKAMADKAGWNEPSLNVYPNTLAPIIRVGDDGNREIVSVTWGMPTPPAFVKGKGPIAGSPTSAMSDRRTGGAGWDRRAAVWSPSHHSRNPIPQAVPNAWLAQNPDRPLMFFAGFWTP